MGKQLSLEEGDVNKRGRKQLVRYLNCAYCDKRFLDKGGAKTSDLRTGKIKHVFCCFEHAMWFRADQRADQKCKRCNKTRGEIKSPYMATNVTGVTFCNGYCPKCYALLHQYKGDEDLCRLHEETQRLKKEIYDKQQREKHLRLTKAATRDD